MRFTHRGNQINKFYLSSYVAPCGTEVCCEEAYITNDGLAEGQSHILGSSCARR
jgi:hypothetical protein